MKNILVGIDGSAEARAAAAFARELAVATGARLTLAGVAFRGDALASPELLVRTQALEEEERAATGRILQALQTELAQPGLTIDTVVDSGPAAVVLADLAKTRDADLVVVGHRGRGALKRLLLGSVADRLVQICPRPVTVVRRDAEG